MSRAKRALSPQELRTLVLNAIPAESNTEQDAPPPAHQFYVPKSHARALNLNIPVVVGSRGTGKSFWWRALQSPEHRALIERFAPDTRIKGNTRVRPGFGARPDMERHPSYDVLSQLRSQGRTEREIWKTVMVWAALEFNEGLPRVADWSEKVAWAVANPEAVDRMLQSADQELQSSDQDLLVVFDSLDRAASDWDVLFRHVEGLLQVALEFRAYRRIRAKVFLRTDQFADGRIGRFPDASKVIASKVDLRWLTTELYALLWQLLANHQGQGADFRELVFQKVVNRQGLDESLESPDVWPLPAATQFDPKTQETLFHALTGPWMGDSPRRGFPYTWLPTHLADAHGEVTPRSFLIALHTAAEDSFTHHVEHGFALHYRSLHAGVQKASSIRKDEIREHHWVPIVIAALTGQLEVPFTLEEVENRWSTEGTLAALVRHRQEELSAGRAIGDGEQPWLLPSRLAQGAAGVVDDLVRLGVFRRMATGRIDVPDVYRLAFGLAKRGGVPLKGR